MLQLCLKFCCGSGSTFYVVTYIILFDKHILENFSTYMREIREKLHMMFDNYMQLYPSIMADSQVAYSSERVSSNLTDEIDEFTMYEK